MFTTKKQKQSFKIMNSLQNLNKTTMLQDIQVLLLKRDSMYENADICHTQWQTIISDNTTRRVPTYLICSLL